jgi:hypothetical protein
MIVPAAMVRTTFAPAFIVLFIVTRLKPALGASIAVFATTPPSSCKRALVGNDDELGTVSEAPSRMVGFAAVSKEADVPFVNEPSTSIVVAEGRYIVPLLVRLVVVRNVVHREEDMVPLLVKVPFIENVAVPEPIVMVPLLVRE